jgi:hypothetical protein
MIPKQWFGLIVRVVGVWVFLHGLNFLLDAFDECVLLGIKHPKIPAISYTVFGLAYDIVGLALIRGARRWTVFAYPDAPGTGEE